MDLKKIIRSMVLSAMTVLTASPQGYAQNAIPNFTDADMANIVAYDRNLVSKGLAPPIALQYDAQIAAMIPESRDIAAKHDEARAHVWGKKMGALLQARAEAEDKFANSPAVREHMSQLSNHPKPDPCISPMGANTCAPKGGGGSDNSDQQNQANEWFMEQQREQQLQQHPY